MKEVDYTLETLLDLDGYIAEIGNEYWFKIEAKKVKIGVNKPFGIKYALTLHDPSGQRIMGFDNAHAVLKGSLKEPHDHFHKGRIIKKYNYISAGKLLEDFWQEVDLNLKGGV
ncbi:MAG TPA: DUF6516 family protein [Gammaproteobacteria bacterium]|nr:DUF6516 family protein [Gammaproteobacteria bacterium]